MLLSVLEGKHIHPDAKNMILNRIILRMTNLIYLELRHDGFTARCVPTTSRIVDTDVDCAMFPSCDIAAAFGHERMLIADFDRASQLFKLAIRELCGPHALFKPVVVLRLCHRFGNSATTVELGALIEATKTAGAWFTYLYHGKDLSDEEIRYALFQQPFPKKSRAPHIVGML